MEKTLENQLNSINTLRSLSHLLNQISSMVIEDNIAEHVTNCCCKFLFDDRILRLSFIKVKLSIESLEKSIELLRNGQLDQSFMYSKTAFASSGM